MAKKNANGEGSRPCKRRDERWEARYWSKGRRWSVYGETLKEVAEKLTKVVAVEEDPPAFVATNIMVGELSVQYEDAVRDTMKRRSFETYLRDVPGYSSAASAAHFTEHEAQEPDAGAGATDVRPQAR